METVRHRHLNNVDDGTLPLYDNKMIATNTNDQDSFEKENVTQSLIDPISNVTTESTESLWTILSEITFPFLIAGLGTVCAGLLLDVVQVLCICGQF